MNVTVRQRKNCRLCEGTDLETVLKLAPTPSGDAYVPEDKLSQEQPLYPLDIVLCHSCDHAQLKDLIDPELLYRNYTYITSVSLGLTKHFEEYAQELLQYTNPPNGALVIDIGSNDGTLLKFFKERGMRVLGIDPAYDVADKANISGIKTIPKFFNAELAREIKEEHGPATIITANNVFANIDNLDDIVSGILTLLKPDGLFVLETSYLLDVLQKTLLETFFHEHISYFSVKPLQLFFKRYGMELINVKRLPTKGGSIRCTVQSAGGPKKVSQAVSKLVSLESKFGLGRKESFKAFSDKISYLKSELFNLLRELKANGRTIAGYGASVGATTMIYQFDIEKLLSFIVDDNTSRHNLFSPGEHIPILPTQALYEHNIAYCVILAWAYTEPIVSKHGGFLKKGGHFIAPLPEINII